MAKDSLQSISSSNITLVKVLTNINQSLSNSPIISIIFLSTFLLQIIGKRL